MEEMSRDHSGPDEVNDRQNELEEANASRPENL